MTPKQYLRQLERINIIINQKQLQLDELRVIGSGFKAIDYAADRVQTSPTDRMAEVMARWVDMESEINETIDRYVDTKNRIINEIHRLQDTRYISILYKRYVEFKPLVTVAYELSYDYKWTCKLHGDALQAFDHAILRTRQNTN